MFTLVQFLTSIHPLNQNGRYARMSTQLHPYELALITNDLSKLNQQERLNLYNKTCESLGLNPLTSPLGYIEFRGGKLSLYAKKDTTDQLRKIHGVSIEITSKEVVNDIYIVCAKATDKTGRIDEDMGTVSIAGLKGEALANAYLKAITKSKRRVTLSICGLGLLDETEVETIPDAKIKEVPIVKEVIEAPKPEPIKIAEKAPTPKPEAPKIQFVTTIDKFATSEEIQIITGWMRTYSITKDEIKVVMSEFGAASSKELKSHDAKIIIECFKACKSHDDFFQEILAFKEWEKNGK